jgi:hypothetical protein
MATHIRTILVDELNGMSWKEHFWYWIFPISLLALLMFFFFSGIPALVEMVNPKMVNPEFNKEWGLLENIQLTIIAVILGLSVYASTRKKPVLQKWGFGLIGVFAIFVFLEETDYGMHISQYFTGVGQSQLEKIVGVPNIHNRYGSLPAKIMKRSVYVMMLLLFVIAPFYKGNFQNRIISYLIPLPKIIIVAIVTVFCELIARLLVPLTNLRFEDLNMDIGEFSEIMVYYVFLLYLWQLVFEKKWEAAK